MRVKILDSMVSTLTDDKYIPKLRKSFNSLKALDTLTDDSSFHFFIENIQILRLFFCCYIEVLSHLLFKFSYIYIYIYLIKILKLSSG